MWRNVSALRKLINRYNVNIVHARSRAPAWSGWLATRRTGVPFVTTYDGALVTYDASDPSDITEVDRLTGLGTPWDLERQDDWLYVADNSLGVIAIDNNRVARIDPG